MSRQPNQQRPPAQSSQGAPSVVAAAAAVAATGPSLPPIKLGEMVTAWLPYPAGIASLDLASSGFSSAPTPIVPISQCLSEFGLVEATPSVAASSSSSGVAMSSFRPPSRLKFMRIQGTLMEIRLFESRGAQGPLAGEGSSSFPCNMRGDAVKAEGKGADDAAGRTEEGSASCESPPWASLYQALSPFDACASDSRDGCTSSPLLEHELFIAYIRFRQEDDNRNGAWVPISLVTARTSAATVPQSIVDLWSAVAAAAGRQQITSPTSDSSVSSSFPFPAGASFPPPAAPAAAIPSNTNPLLQPLRASAPVLSRVPFDPNISPEIGELYVEGRRSDAFQQQQQQQQWQLQTTGGKTNNNNSSTNSSSLVVPVKVPIVMQMPSLCEPFAAGAEAGGSEGVDGGGEGVATAAKALGKAPADAFDVDAESQSQTQTQRSTQHSSSVTSALPSSSQLPTAPSQGPHMPPPPLPPLAPTVEVHSVFAATANYLLRCGREKVIVDFLEGRLGRDFRSPTSQCRYYLYLMVPSPSSSASAVPSPECDRVSRRAASGSGVPFSPSPDSSVSFPFSSSRLNGGRIGDINEHFIEGFAFPPWYYSPVRLLYGGAHQTGAANPTDGAAEAALRHIFSEAAGRCLRPPSSLSSADTTAAVGGEADLSSPSSQPPFIAPTHQGALNGDSDVADADALATLLASVPPRILEHAMGAVVPDAARGGVESAAETADKGEGHSALAPLLPALASVAAAASLPPNRSRLLDLHLCPFSLRLFHCMDQHHAAVDALMDLRLERLLSAENYRHRGGGEGAGAAGGDAQPKKHTAAAKQRGGAPNQHHPHAASSNSGSAPAATCAYPLCPPGTEIYHDSRRGVSVYCVPGDDHRPYVRNVFLATKGLLENKLVGHDVSLYTVYAVCLHTAVHFPRYHAWLLRSAERAILRREAKGMASSGVASPASPSLSSPSSPSSSATSAAIRRRLAAAMVRRSCVFGGFYSTEEGGAAGGFNLACIMSLPCFGWGGAGSGGGGGLGNAGPASPSSPSSAAATSSATPSVPLAATPGKGIGSFIIRLSYELAFRQGLIGTPERPLSDLGERAYASYWRAALLSWMRGVVARRADPAALAADMRIAVGGAGAVGSFAGGGGGGSGHSSAAAVGRKGAQQQQQESGKRQSSDEGGAVLSSKGGGMRSGGRRGRGPNADDDDDDAFYSDSDGSSSSDSAASSSSDNEDGEKGEEGRKAMTERGEGQKRAIVIIDDDADTSARSNEKGAAKRPRGDVGGAANSAEEKGDEGKGEDDFSGYPEATRHLIRRGYDGGWAAGANAFPSSRSLPPPAAQLSPPPPLPPLRSTVEGVAAWAGISAKDALVALGEMGVFHYSAADGPSSASSSSSFLVGGAATSLTLMIPADALSTVAPPSHPIRAAAAASPVGGVGAGAPVVGSPSGLAAPSPAGAPFSVGDPLVFDPRCLLL